MSKTIKIRKGLNIPILGGSEKIVQTASRAALYALKPTDFHGLIPKMLVKEGDTVRAGSPLFYDKYNEKVLFTSPVSGVFHEVVRGAKRRILGVVVKPDENDTFVDFGAANPSTLSRQEIVDKLLSSGCWPFIRQRPFSIIASPQNQPRDIFVSAFSTSPLAIDLDLVVAGNETYFQTGLDVLAKLTKGKVHLSIDSNNTRSKAFIDAKNVEIHKFCGPHPAGNVGIQIHHVSPINKGEIVWYADVQDIVVIGKLFQTGQFDATRVVALSGSEVIAPKYYRTKIGAQVNSITEGKLVEETGIVKRLISGDVLTGTKVETTGFLGFYHGQISVIPEGYEPQMFGWIAPNFNRFSISRTFPSFLFPGKKYRHDTNIRSGERAFVFTGVYEKVLPMDVMPMQLLKAILVNDIDKMEQLGIYEVAPEDFALCEYVCPSKIDIQDLIWQGLDSIRAEFA